MERLERLLRRILMVLAGLLLLQVLILLPPMAWRVWSNAGAMYSIKETVRDSIDTFIHGKVRCRCQNSVISVALALPSESDPKRLSPGLVATNWEAMVPNPLTIKFFEPSIGTSWKMQEVPHLHLEALGGTGCWEDNLNVLRPWAYTEAYYALDELP